MRWSCFGLFLTLTFPGQARAAILLESHWMPPSYDPFLTEEERTAQKDLKAEAEAEEEKEKEKLAKKEGKKNDDKDGEKIAEKEELVSDKLPPLPTRGVRLYVRGRYLRVEYQTEKGARIFLFNSKTDRFYSLQPRSKTYIEMTPSQLPKLRRKFALTAPDQVEKLTKLPKSEKKFLSSLLSRSVADHYAKTTFDGKEGADKVGRWPAKRYEGMFEEKKQQDVWATDWRELGMTAKEFGTLRKAQRFLKYYAADVAYCFDVGPKNWLISNQYPGLPIRRVLYDSEGEVVEQFMLQKVRWRNYRKSMFAVPKGYRKQPFPLT